MKRLSRIRNEQGQSVVEFAIVLPILLIIIGGIIDFGWVYSNQLSLNNCAREGARYAVVHATEQDAGQKIREKVLALATDTIKDTMTVDITFTNISNPEEGDVIIQVRSNIPVLTPIVGVFFENQQIGLVSRVVMRVE